MTEQSNTAKGRTSFDANISGDLVHFINRNVTPYATESAGPNFDLVPVREQKDLMINAARMHAKQEYDRIMQLVAVLQQQAADIKKRLDITDAVHGAVYDFKIYAGQYYWLVWDSEKSITRLVHLGPDDWATAAPQHYQYLTKIQWLGDHTWREVDG